MQQPSQDQRRAEYEAYLRSPVWQEKRAVALERAGRRCQLCNRDKRLDVHHRTYERFGGAETPEDLTVLCRKCHEHFHGKQHVATPKWKNYGERPSAEELEEVRKTLQPGREFTAGELGQLLGWSSQRCGTVLQRLRKSGVVKKTKKRWRLAPGKPALRLVRGAQPRPAALPKTEKDKARQRVADAISRMAPGEVYTTSAIAEMAEVSVTRAGGFLSGFARRKQGVDQLGNKRWRSRQVNAA